MIKARIVDYDEFFDQIRNIRDDVFCKEQGIPQETLIRILGARI
jgi:hypothetical protein